MKAIFKILRTIGILICILFFIFPTGILEGQRSDIKGNIISIKILDKFGGLDVPKEQFFDNPVDIVVSEERLFYCW